MGWQAVSWEFERGPDGQVARIKIHTEDWLCPACGQKFPAESNHNHGRIICSGSIQEQIPAGRTAVPEQDAWLAERKP